MLAGSGPTSQAFTFRSGHIALDFAATLMFRSAPASALELLTDGDALSRWAQAAGLADIAPEDTVLPDAIATREAIYALALARIAGAAPAAHDLATLNRHAAGASLALSLGRDGTLRRSGGAGQLIATLAREAVELFGGPDAARLRQCSREGCTRLYVDRSRGTTRVWCGMRECGNRVNAAVYRRRQAERRRSPRAA